nr:lambda exonuclease family protein [Massilia sp. TS11]
MARVGVITASMFSTARQRVNGLTSQQQRYVDAILAGASVTGACDIAGYKNQPRAEAIERALAGESVGEPSEAAKNYAFRLAIERISREPLDEGFQTYAMKRGHELEPDARMEHELQTGLIVQRAGFVMTDDYLYGASADGLIAPDGGSEYKCLISAERLRDVWLFNDTSDFTDQVQGCMWITDRQWWDFCVYCPSLKPIGKQLYRRRIARDDAYIAALQADLFAFERMVSDYETTLRMKEAA